MMTYVKRLFVVSFFLLTATLAQAAENQMKDTVTTAAGWISGLPNSDGDIHIFKGIPFAAPPVGALRWQAPRPPQPWSGVKQCTAFAPSPMQPAPAPFSMWSEEFLIPKQPISEDCLYLNVWSGAASATEKRPVLVWIYGGGFTSGGSAVPIYDGEAMAKKGIVFVSLNYRVGIFGFFAHPALTKESPHQASGNYGLMDQVAALQWVQQNIAAFGGDPANVTIAGQSAGSMSVSCLVASPLAKGLFTKAIAESGASVVASAVRGTATLQQAEADGVAVANALQAATLSDLRHLSADALLKAQPAIRGPIVDGYVLPQSVAALFAAGKENKVALLTGWNENEGLMFAPVKTAADFGRQLQELYGADADKLLQYYPATNDSVAAASQAALFGRDIIFGVQNYAWANMAGHKGQAVYLYRFTRHVPGTGDYAKYGAFHTGEVPYAYDNLSFVKRPWQAADSALAHVMSDYWANFIKTGNPNGDGLPEWKAFTPKEKEVMMLGDTQQSMPLKDAAQLDLLLSLMKGKS